MNNQNRSLQILNMLPHYLMVGALTEETVPTAQTIVHSNIVKRDCSHESLKAVARAAELVNQQVIMVCLLATPRSLEYLDLF